MTVALSDAALLSDMLQPLPSFADQLATAHETAAFYTKRKPLSATINTLANALYRVSVECCFQMKTGCMLACLQTTWFAFIACADLEASAGVRLDKCPDARTSQSFMPLAPAGVLLHG